MSPEINQREQHDWTLSDVAERLQVDAARLLMWHGVDVGTLGVDDSRNGLALSTHRRGALTTDWTKREKCFRIEGDVSLMPTPSTPGKTAETTANPTSSSGNSVVLQRLGQWPPPHLFFWLSVTHVCLLLTPLVVESYNLLSNPLLWGRPRHNTINLAPFIFSPELCSHCRWPGLVWLSLAYVPPV